MTPRIQGMGWVTPFGRGIQAGWEAVCDGRTPAVEPLANPFSGREHRVARVPADALSDVARIPRLRRSSTISHLAVAAAIDAITGTGCDPAAENLAVVFAATNGGVHYTRRFFADISTAGAQAGSPLLFPETVYNAPASHIAAHLGTSGIATTIVNDATAGIDAIAAATELLESGSCDRCLVVGAEELDWIIGEAYAAWAPRLPVFAEGAAAILLGHDGGAAIERTSSPRAFRSIAEGAERLRAFADSSPPADLAISSTSGVSLDAVEIPLTATLPRILTPKIALGEVFATSTLQAVICAAHALDTRTAAHRALVLATGSNAQAAALSLVR